MAEGKLTRQQLLRKRAQAVKELNQIQQELDLIREEDRHIMRAEDIQWAKSGEVSVMLKNSQYHRKTAKLVAPELGFNVHNFQVGCIEIEPGSQEGAYHMHGEAVKYYLQGRGVEIIGDKSYEVKAGDTVFIPANTWHGTQNPGTEPVRCLVVTHSSMGVPLFIWPKIKIRDDSPT